VDGVHRLQQLQGGLLLPDFLVLDQFGAGVV